MKRVHRHFKRLSQLLYMYNISFSIQDDGSIYITNVTLHPVTEGGIMDHDILPKNVAITYAIKLNVLKMLYEDGIIVSP